MTTYRVTPIGDDGRAGPWFAIECADDVTAIAAVIARAYPGEMKLHDGERLVADVPALAPAAGRGSAVWL